MERNGNRKRRHEATKLHLNNGQTHQSQQPLNIFIVLRSHFNQPELILVNILANPCYPGNLLDTDYDPSRTRTQDASYPSLRPLEARFSPSPEARAAYRACVLYEKNTNTPHAKTLGYVAKHITTSYFKALQHWWLPVKHIQGFNTAIHEPHGTIKHALQMTTTRHSIAFFVMKNKPNQPTNLVTSPDSFVKFI